MHHHHTIIWDWHQHNNENVVVDIPIETADNAATENPRTIITKIPIAKFHSETNNPYRNNNNIIIRSQ